MVEIPLKMDVHVWVVEKCERTNETGKKIFIAAIIFRSFIVTILIRISICVTNYNFIFFFFIRPFHACIAHTNTFMTGIMILLLTAEHQQNQQC